MAKPLDLTGKIFGRFTVLNKTTKTKHGKYKWLCSCDCGAKKEVVGSNLVSGAVNSCGCLRNDRRRSVTHNLSRSTEYSIWIGMKSRCLNRSNRSYGDYGGRGITICKRWIESFEDFYIDMGERPSPKHSIDRVDNSEGYSPSNCRWSTFTQQANNRRIKKTNKSGVQGVHFSTQCKRWIVQDHGAYIGRTLDFLSACCIRKSIDAKRI